MATDPLPTSAESTRPASLRRQPDLLLAATLALLMTSWNYALERGFDRVKLVDQFDVLFNADPVTRLDAISQGKGAQNDLITHPGFKVYFSRPIRLAGKLSRNFGLIADTPRAEYDLRRELALAVIPAVSGLTMAGAFVLFTWAGLSRPQALLMTLLCCVSFSQLIFASLPEHMPLSSLLVTALLLQAHDMAVRDAPLRWWAWSLLGGLYAGTTITNAAPFVILFATARVVSGRAWRPAAREVVIVTAGMLAVTAGLAVAGRKVAGNAPWPLGRIQHHASAYRKNALHRIPIALLETFAPAGLVQRKMPPEVAEWNLQHTGRSTPKRFDTSNAAMPSTILVAFSAFMISGAWGWRHVGGAGWAVGAAALGVTAFHLILHSFWGDASFLYSQHWLVPAAVLLAGNLTWPGNFGRAFVVVYGVGGVIMLFHNVTLLNQIFETLAAAPY